MEYSVVGEELDSAEGTVKYKDCKYSNGEKLVGDKGTWKAEQEHGDDLEDDNDSTVEETDTEEYVYADDHD